tara:strand:+ start:186 stop:350 length:165 start_codon:yes stop_codon:yes gene_type:complete
MTHNEEALSNFINDVNKTFYYIGELEDDKVDISSLKAFNKCTNKFVNSLKFTYQ